MHKTAMVNIRIEPTLKVAAECILNEAGLTSTEAVRLFYKQICLHRGLPFKVKIPNEATREVFAKTDKKIGLVKCKNAKDLFKKLGI